MLQSNVTKQCYKAMLQSEGEINNIADVRNLYNYTVLSEILESNADNEPDGKIFRANSVVVLDSDGVKELHKGIETEEQIIRYMENALELLTEENRSLINIAIFHYIFGYIIKKHIGTYYKMFKETNDEKNKGELTYFVTKFLDIILEEIEDMNVTLKIKMGKLSKYLIEIDENIEGIEKKLLNILIQNKLYLNTGVSIVELKKYTEISETKIREIMMKYKKSEMVKIEKKGKANVYRLQIEVFENYINKQILT